MQTPDQIRTVVRTLRDRWQADMFPARTELPKTLIFAKDDNHAEKIVEILREEFGRGNEFGLSCEQNLFSRSFLLCQKNHRG